MKTNNIKEVRLKRVMTQQQLAEKMGVQQQVISRWEQGLVYPEFQNMLKLSEALDSSVDELFVRGVRMLSKEEKDRIDVIREVLGGILFFGLLIFMITIGLILL